MAELKRREVDQPATRPEQEQTVRHESSWVDCFKAGIPSGELSSGACAAMNPQVLVSLKDSMAEHEVLYRELSK